MPYKQSPREKRLRRIAESVKDAMRWEIGSNPGMNDVTEFQDQLDFLTTEIKRDRCDTNGALDDFPDVKPL